MNKQASPPEVKAELNSVPLIIKQLFISSFIVFLLLIVITYLYYFNRLENDIYLNGVLSDAINLLILIGIFAFVQTSVVAKRSYLFLSVGIFLWSVGLTFDFLDELVFQPIWVGIYIEDITRTLGMLVTGFGLYLALTDLAKTREQLEEELKTDVLTKAYNRRYFYHYVQQNQDKPHSLVIADIDHFKAINDEYGHDVGDQVLIDFVYQCHQALDESILFARIGGEEFALYVATDDADELRATCEQLLSLANNVMVTPSKTLSVSVGSAIKRATETFSNTMKRADQALYLAKNQGRSRYIHKP
ncbi:GGDEF domain-containing protein [Pseudoalteromonas sp. 2CM39R]|uniref:GGDEF domain-containing protein n=1 Tax=Pseudoalteromonas sp. 2CM39R TaxID=2929856 RepID=UPI0020C1387F|nr:GGDEF domain-containing protein [Pseudoalteromonas sp. 2CM39R]MCK8125953.1 GGDEF domain-containing protein [Pseudoalteromonas sp. 2CM39R]